MKKWPNNPEAVKLRKAAIAFADGAEIDPEDDEDKKGQKRNQALLQAAVDYAKVATGDLGELKHVIVKELKYPNAGASDIVGDTLEILKRHGMLKR